MGYDEVSKVRVQRSQAIQVLGGGPDKTHGMGVRLWPPLADCGGK